MEDVVVAGTYASALMFKKSIFPLDITVKSDWLHPLVVTGNVGNG
jgi:hypothetical protein